LWEECFLWPGLKRFQTLKKVSLNAQAVMSKPARYMRDVVEAVVVLALEGRPPGLRVVPQAE
jgi:hypothetical protein